MSQPKISKKPISLVILGIALLFLTLHLLRSSVSWVEGAFVHREYPISFSSSIYKELLKTFVKGGLVDYTHLHGSPLLAKAVEELKCTSPDHIVGDSDRLAFWINAYNLLTLEALSERYPINSPQALGHTHSARQFLVGGKPETLQDIYDSEITPLATKVDVKTIFLVCDGCVGSPALSEYPVSRERLKNDTEEAVYKFVNDPRNAVYDADRKKFSISPFFQWHHALLEKVFPTPHHFVNTYLEPSKRIDVDDIVIMKSYLPAFDWRLNDAAAIKGEHSIGALMIGDQPSLNYHSKTWAQQPL